MKWWCWEGASCEDVSSGMSVEGIVWVQRQSVTFSLDFSCVLESINNKINIHNVVYNITHFKSWWYIDSIYMDGS